MKKLIGLMSAVILIICSITCFSCVSKEELTESEKTFVGTWVLSDDITYTDLENVRYQYPSSLSDSFNSFCEKYIGKVILMLDGTKINGEMSGTITINDEETKFTWYVDRSGSAIKFSPFITLPDYSSSFDYTRTALLQDNRLFVVTNFNKSTLMFFEKLD